MTKSLPRRKALSHLQEIMSIRKLNNALQQKAIKELNEDPNRIQEDINYIKEWLKQQPHLNSRTDDQFLVSFLRASKYSLQETQQRLDNFYTIRTEFSQYLKNRDPFLPEIQQLLDLGVILPLPKTVGDDGPRIILVRYGAEIQNRLPEFIKSSFVEGAIKAGSMFLDILLKEDDNFIIGGQQGISDTKGAGPEHIIQLLPSLMKLAQEMLEAMEAARAEQAAQVAQATRVSQAPQANSDKKTESSEMEIDENVANNVNQVIGNKLSTREKHQLIVQGTKLAPKAIPLFKRVEKWLEEGYPSKPQRWDFINPPQMWQMAYGISKQILKDSYTKKMFFHENEEDLYKIVPQSVLPKEYGGDGGSIDEIKDYWKKKIESYRDWFLEEEQYCCDESKRPPDVESNIVADGTFGVEGTFRKLVVE